MATPYSTEVGVIVVGVDFSEGAKSALRFGLAEAKLRQSTLRVVHAWQFEYLGVSGIEGFYPTIGPDLSDVRRAAEAGLEAILAEVVSDEHNVEVVAVVTEGAAGAVLVAESQKAELLVVGSRGHGGFAGLLLGSVSQQCAHHASCPVVIIPHKRES
jgi:nucleotide-binding universal stress UspA family protein